MFVDKKTDREIQALEAHCEMIERGCGWIGPVKDIDRHLDDDCLYVDVKCTNECGAQMTRNELMDHLHACPKRPCKCSHCHLRHTYEFIHGEHVNQCKKRPIPCPNNCETGMIPRFQMEYHIQMECPLQEVTCEFRDCGCNVTIKRKCITKHRTEYVMEHVAMFLDMSGGERCKTLQSMLLRQVKDAQDKLCATQDKLFATHTELRVTKMSLTSALKHKQEMEELMKSKEMHSKGNGATAQNHTIASRLYYKLKNRPRTYISLFTCIVVSLTLLYLLNPELLSRIVTGIIGFLAIIIMLPLYYYMCCCCLTEAMNTEKKSTYRRKRERFHY